MNSITKVALAANLLLLSSVPGLTHPGHGFDNPVLHRIHHWLGGLDPDWAALAGVVAGLALWAVLYARLRRANRS